MSIVFSKCLSPTEVRKNWKKKQSVVVIIPKTFGKFTETHNLWKSFYVIE